jgi:hypothetical protein
MGAWSERREAGEVEKRALPIPFAAVESVAPRQRPRSVRRRTLPWPLPVRAARQGDRNLRPDARFCGRFDYGRRCRPRERVQARRASPGGVRLSSTVAVGDVVYRCGNRRGCTPQLCETSLGGWAFHLLPANDYATLSRSNHPAKEMGKTNPQLTIRQAGDGESLHEGRHQNRHFIQLPVLHHKLDVGSIPDVVQGVARN